ncbi:MAG: DUF4037 domain-containing protein [Lachnospiraceae bacterium]|nr:DUF4037 domain-containing protein [Lachnospiraceae bacterium]
MTDDKFGASRFFYDNEVKAMIDEKFAQFADRIAVGIAGEGSDCFGYDDLISRDHDFGTGVCLWLTDENMEEFGADLSDAYAELIDRHSGGGLSARLRERRGVMTIHDFYSNILGTDCDVRGLISYAPGSGNDFWQRLDHSCLATAVNGEVFRDDLGEFSAFRKFLLDYYPENIWRIRIAEELHRFSAALQVNYARCMTRGDVVAASLCKLQGIEAAMQLFFLLKREYPPYYKWTFRRMEETDRDGMFSRLIREMAQETPNPEIWKNHRYSSDKLNTDDKTVILTEKLAAHIVNMLGQRGFIRNTDPYLEKYVDEILRPFGI